MITGKPTFSDVQRELSRRRTVRAKWEKEALIDQDYYLWSLEWLSDLWRPYIKGFPPDYKPKLPPIGYLAVQRAVNNVHVGETAVVEVELPRDVYKDNEEKRREAINILQEWYVAALQEIDTFSTESPLRDFWVQMFKVGPGCLSYPLRSEWVEDPPTGWADEAKRRPKPGETPEQRAALRRWQRKRKRLFPWAVASEMPLHVFWDPDHDVPWDFIIEDRIARSDGEDAVESDARPSGEHGQAVRIQFISERWHGRWIDGRPALGEDDGADESGIAPNDLGMPWLRLAYSGLGDQDSTGDFVHRIRGILRGSRDAIVQKVINLNVKAVVLQSSAYQQLKFSGAGAQKLRDAWATEGGPGASIADEGGQVVVTLMPTPQTPKEVFDLDTDVNQILEMALGPDLLEGVYRPETASGMRSRASFAKAPYKAPQQSGQQAIAAMLMDFTEQIREMPQFRAGVTVRGVTLRPADVVDHFVKVNVTPPTEEDKAFKRKEVLDELSAQLITREDAVREIRQEADPAAYVRKIDVEKMKLAILGTPQMLQLGTQQALAQLGVPASPPAAADPAGGGMPGEPAPAEALPTMQAPPPSLGGPQDMVDQAAMVVNAPAVAPLPGAPVGVGR